MTSSDQNTSRCFGILGTARTGPLYCGNKAKSTDVNGRPVCGVHRNGHPHNEWTEKGFYPNGPRGKWRFWNGEARA